MVASLGKLDGHPVPSTLNSKVLPCAQLKLRLHVPGAGACGTAGHSQGLGFKVWPKCKA